MKARTVSKGTGRKKKSSTRGETLSRPAMERIARIHQALQEEEWPSAISLAREIEVNERTIRRDIEFMRNRMKLPISFCFRRRGYHYTEPVREAPTLKLTRGKLVAFCVAQRAFAAFAGTVLEAELRIAFEQMLEGLDQEVIVGLDTILDSVRFRSESFEVPVDVTILDRLIEASQKQEWVAITHRKNDGSPVSRRQVQPYGVLRHRGAWYLVGHDSLREMVITFALHRIGEVQATGETFLKPKNFDLRAHLPDEFGIFGGTPEAVEIRFVPETAPYVRERRWHSSQQFEELPDGGVILRMQAVVSPELEQWTLGWGSRARVIGPDSLKQRIAREVQAMAAGEGKPG